MNNLSATILIAIALLILYSVIRSRSAAMLSTVQALTPQQYQQQFVQNKQKHLLLDVRQPDEFKNGHIPGAKNISVQTLEQRLNEVHKAQPIVLYCRSGNRTKMAAQVLGKAGYTQVYDLGGIMQWQAQGLPMQ
jgi:rhodanese-related sulfurtransferase